MKHAYFSMKARIMHSASKVFIAFSLLALVTSGCKDDDDNNDDVPPQEDVSQADKDFMMKATLANRAEIELGELAASKGQHDSVKAFGRLMVTEHTTAQNELNALASSKQVTLPAAPDSAHQALSQQLKTMSGNKFDSTYIHHQVMDHQKTQQDFQAEINQGKNADVKNYANKYLPHINMHLDRVKKIQTMVN